MINSNEIKTKAESKYLGVLRELVEGKPFTRLVIRGNKSYTKSSLSEFEKEIINISSQSKEKKGFGYTLEFQKVKTKYLGNQDLPISIYFDSEKDFFKYLGKEKEVEYFKTNAEKIIRNFSELKQWVIQNPAKVIGNQQEWDNILLVCHYFKANPKPNLYVRELPIPVHTKFIERNKTLIKDLLNILIAEYICREESEFEKRFNLKYQEPVIHFKILDKEISHHFFYGLDDLSIPLSQFERLNLPLKKVIIVENKTSLYTTLTLPNMKNTLAIFGSGYAVLNLKNVKWFQQLELLYWGDIDVQGFEILSQFRVYFNKTKSMLMDMITFEKFFENDLGAVSPITTTLSLTENEKQLYEKLKANNWRLEQEKIPLNYVNQYFDKEYFNEF